MSLLGISVQLCLLMCAAYGVNNKKRAYRETNHAFINESSEICNNRNLELRLQRLENYMDDKLSGVRREIWSNARNIEQITKTAIAGIQVQESSPKDTERQLQVLIAIVRIISNDITQLNKSLTEMHNKQEIDSSVKEVFETPGLARQSPPIPTSCQEIKQTAPASPSNVYLVQPKNSSEPFMVFCEMDFMEGGWLTIHNRFAGEQEFYRDWQDYKWGFGNIAAEHWLGLERVHQLTGKDINELLVQLIDNNNARTFARYTLFSLGSEEEGYNLKVLGGFEGNAGDSLSYHAGSKFSTKDRDLDTWFEGSCAQAHGGAWWYKSCDKSNLNGKYMPGDQPAFLKYQAMYWETFGGSQKGLKYARMMIRPRN
ncbi:microfibril-associated glycoprotein 4-like [Euwallacea fornicatus]|uniref:microfibril-associated glycoprotein 4-like n=1 Tax=Euwallacea fornicatus TaxID=995702 RepID=UPI00338D6886